MSQENYRRHFMPQQGPHLLCQVNQHTFQAQILAFDAQGLLLSSSQRPVKHLGQANCTLHYAHQGQEVLLTNFDVQHVQQTPQGQWQWEAVATQSNQQKAMRQCVALLTGKATTRKNATGQEQAVALPPGSGPTKMPRFSMAQHYKPHAVAQRLDWAAGVSASQPQHLQKHSLEPQSLAGNIENFIGAVQVPVGLAGPVHVKGAYIDAHVPVPLATTEGALISSVSRGAWLCNLSGGIEVQVQRQHMVRAPILVCGSLAHATAAARWVEQHTQAIAAKAQSASATAQLQKLETFVFDNAVHLRFVYHTGDASGQNMTTACTWVACEYIAEQLQEHPQIDFDRYIIEGNQSGDKKANLQNIGKGRGIGVTATCLVPERLLKKVMRVSVDQMLYAWQGGEVGAYATGMMGANVNFANVIAGIFTATGQDIASVHESATGLFKLRREGNNLRVNVHLPALVIGTVGGGTHLPTQRECLDLMGCQGSGKVYRLAEIIAASCLALDISTCAAVATNEFVHAHEQLGRNKPVRRLTQAEINPDFFNSLWRFDDQHITQAHDIGLEQNQGIINTLVAKRQKGPGGVYRYRLTVQNQDQCHEQNVILKLKQPDTALIETGAGLTRLSGHDLLPGLYQIHSHVFGFDQSHTRELQFYQHAPAALQALCPRWYGVVQQPERNLFGLLLEDLSAHSHLDTVHNPERWHPQALQAVLKGMAQLHHVYWQRFEAVPTAMQVPAFEADPQAEAAPMLKALTAYNQERYPEWLDEDLCQHLHHFLANMPQCLAQMQQAPQTLTHNDFNTRNLCLRQQQDESLKLVLFDWELCTFQNAQHDLAEFLIYALPQNTTAAQFKKWVRYYFDQLRQQTGQEMLFNDFCQVFYLNALHLALFRLNLYMLLHNVHKLPYLGRVLANLRTLILAGPTLANTPVSPEGGPKATPVPATLKTTPHEKH